MLKQFNEKFWGEFVKKRGSIVIDRDEQKRIIESAKVVRQCDYVVDLEVKNGVSSPKTITTRSNWLFLLTNAYFYWELNNKIWLTFGLERYYPKVSVDFYYFEPKTPFDTKKSDFNSVPAKLVFGGDDRSIWLNGLSVYVDGYERFEEYKNLYYLLDQRFVINAEIKPESGLYCRGHLLLTGLEIDLDGVK